MTVNDLTVCALLRARMDLLHETETVWRNATAKCVSTELRQPLDKQAGWTFRFDFQVRLTDTRRIHRHDDVFNSASPVNSVDMQFCRHSSLRTARNDSAQKQFATAYIRNALLQWSHILTSQSLHSCWWGLVSLQHQHLPAATRYSVLASKYELSSKQHSQASKNYEQYSQARTLNTDSQAGPRKSKDRNREQLHYDNDRHFSILQRVVYFIVCM